MSPSVSSRPGKQCRELSPSPNFELPENGEKFCSQTKDVRSKNAKFETNPPPYGRRKFRGKFEILSTDDLPRRKFAAVRLNFVGNLECMSNTCNLSCPAHFLTCDDAGTCFSVPQKSTRRSTMPTL